MTDEVINSDLYWNKRFGEDWESCDGPRQSSSFARMAIEHLPHWLMDQVRQKSLTFADWGCAQGDGTDVWANYIDASQISGVDFSSIAIEQAARRYPAIRFINDNWLAGDGGQREVFDIVFSSNTLEHFHEPYDALLALSVRAKKAVVLILPYREIERIDEHFFSFVPENIPLVLQNGFKLVWTQVADCRQISGAPWSGDQIVLVYADPEWVGSLSLTLKDGIIQQIDTASEIKRLSAKIIERDGQLASFNQAVAERDGQIDELKQAANEQESRIVSLNQAVAERDGQIDELKQAANEQESRIISLNQAVAERDGWITEIKQALDRVLSEFRVMEEHKSYRIAKMLQIIRHPEIIGGESAIFSILKIWHLKLRGREIAPHYHVLTAPLEKLEKTRSATSIYCGRVHEAISKNGEVVVFASVPMDDIGGGQRSAQIARCLMDRMCNVRYFYRYPKIENGRSVANQFEVERLSHRYLEGMSPSCAFNGIPRTATVIFEIPHPDFIPFLEEATRMGLQTVYELIDPWETSLGAGWYSPEVEEEFIKSAKRVVGTAKTLHRKLIKAGRKDALYLPNAADERYFCRYKKYPIPHDYPSGFDKTILYFGSLYGEWFEWGFLRVAAERNPTVGFLLIGDPPENRNMPPNVVFMGMRNNHELSNYLQACDATMIPFRPGEIVDAVSPVKVFEYLFLGKPVISTKMVEIINYPGVYQAEDQNEFARLCSLELISQASGNELDTFFSQNSWNSRVDQIVSWPQLSFKYSIITLIHNNEKIIRRHLDTLLFHLRDIPVEIIIVDNCSVDNGPGIVKEEYGDRVKLVCNPVNGCSSGRNLGATAACGDILVFFDSDQWFTSVAWLYEADFLICKHPEVGAFGWGSGWFADKNLGGPIVDYIDKRGIFSDEYKSVGFRTDIHYLATCGFFVTRALFERVGGFDPIFDPTIFEDTDLSLKIVDYGLKVAYRNFCGIMHQPHQTTKAAEQSAIYQELWNRNKDHMWHKWEAMLNDKLGKGHHEIH